MDRVQARAIFKEVGLTYDMLTPANVQRLRAHINEQMKSDGLIQGTLRCHQRGVRKNTPNGLYVTIRCKAYYFDDREAVSFNPDGFIGFAGWASENNVQPILVGFVNWVEEMKLKKGFKK